MRRSTPSLEALRNTLLAACGLSLGACTSVPAELPLPEQSSPPDSSRKPKPEPEPKPEPAPPVVASACKNPTPVIAGGVDTGFVRCEDEALNRASAQRCFNPITVPACTGNETHQSCRSHADCRDKPHGYCRSGSGQLGSYCGCVYPCLEDSECDDDEACLCPDIADPPMDVSRCVPAGCRVDADCSSGECGTSYNFNGCDHDVSLQCRTEADGCRSNASCASDPDGYAGSGPACLARVQLDDQGRELPLGSFACVWIRCAIGRPLSVEQGARVAGLRGQAWGSTRVEGLAASADRAAHWLAIARMEHASVASFARFTADLLRFAAPPQLLREALAAAADEVEHAEQTFALASAYAGSSLGPGPLQIDDLGTSATLEQFVGRLIHEACVGETVGVAEALALLELELDPALRPRLEQIAADELRHASLAWRTLQWCAAQVDPALVGELFDAAIRAVERVEAEPEDPAHGRLGQAARRRLRLAAIEQVIEPCRRALLACA